MSKEEFLLPRWMESPLDALATQWEEEGRTSRLWGRDASLWTGRDEGAWLGWLDLPESELLHLPSYQQCAQELLQEGTRRVILLGMGGSSLGAEMLFRICPRKPESPTLLLLDTTNPRAILRASKDLQKTAFLVSSKSGTTLEPNLLFAYFFDLVSRNAEPTGVGRSFIAVTDPGSPLEKLAKEKGFRNVFHGVPSVGGRYSVLSAFGLLPATLVGVDPGKLLSKAKVMREACRQERPVRENPGVFLGILLGLLATQGKDKVTFLSSPSLASFGSWAEQLLAESTGKEGKAVLPIAGESLGEVFSYGADRVFVYQELEGEENPRIRDRLQELAQAGHPVLCFQWKEREDVSAECFRWEVATAVAGSLLGIHPFDQPDVEAAKEATREFARIFQATGRLPEPSPFVEEEGISAFLGERQEARFLGHRSESRPLLGVLQAYWQQVHPGDYVALLPFVDPESPTLRVLEEFRQSLRSKKKVATCLGLGPRYLHSIGQAFKGGPNTGVFLLVTEKGGEPPVPIPGERLDFQTVHLAQALGDFRVLAERGRRVLRLHVTNADAEGTGRLKEVLEASLAAA